MPDTKPEPDKTPDEPAKTEPAKTAKAADGPTYYNCWAAPIAVTTTRVENGAAVQVTVDPGRDLPADADPAQVETLQTVGYVAQRV